MRQQVGIREHFRRGNATFTLIVALHEPLRQALPSPDAPAYRNAEERVRNLVREIVARAEEAEALRPRVQHRALPDAESLWRTWRLVQQGVAKAIEAGQVGG